MSQVPWRTWLAHSFAAANGFSMFFFRLPHGWQVRVMFVVECPELNSLKDLGPDSGQAPTLDGSIWGWFPNIIAHVDICRIHVVYMWYTIDVKYPWYTHHNSHTVPYPWKCSIPMFMHAHGCSGARWWTNVAPQALRTTRSFRLSVARADGMDWWPDNHVLRPEIWGFHQQK